jgi:hypothetical protein
MNGSKKSIYIESTIPSYATARHSRDAIIAGRQAATVLFWDQERQKYDLYISEFVLEECADGDKDAAKRRIDFLQGITLLRKTPEIVDLGLLYQDLLRIPDRSKTDCFHLAACVILELDYLLSWNCTHLGVASNLSVREYNEKKGLWTPILVTPEYFIPTEEMI